MLCLCQALEDSLQAGVVRCTSVWSVCDLGAGCRGGGAWWVDFRNLNLPKMTNFESTEMLRVGATSHSSESPWLLSVSGATPLRQMSDRTWLHPYWRPWSD